MFTSYLETAITHAPKYLMLAQLLRRDAGTRDAERDAGQEASVVADGRGGQYGVDSCLVDAVAFLLTTSSSTRTRTRVVKHDSSLRDAEITVPTSLHRWHAVLVAEMPRQFTAQAVGVSDEVDDAPDAPHVRLLPRFDLRVDGGHESVLGVLALGEGGQDAEAVDDAAGVEVDGAGVVPLLQFPDRVRAGEAGLGGGRVDVDPGPLLGRLAGPFEGLGDRGGVCGAGFEGGGLEVFVLGVLWRDRPDEPEAKFELRVQEVQGVFLVGEGGLGQGLCVLLVISERERLTRMSHSLDSSFRFRSMISPALECR